jgi:adenylylsulfate kinase-like enzyme
MPAGILRFLTCGSDSPYEPPLKPDIRLETADLSIDAASSEIIAHLRDQGII